jgi:NitT/TauT family transport system permease protein
VLYAAPKYVLVPLLFVRFGSGFLPRYYLVTLAVFPVVAMYVLGGLRTVDPDTVSIMRLFGAGRRQIAQKVMIPHAGNYLVTAIVYVIPHALSMAIGAEILFGTTEGLGGQLFSDSQAFDSAGLYATLAVATAIAVLLVGLTRIFERRFSPSGRATRPHP